MGDQPPFGILASSHPLITQPSSRPSQTSFLYSLPTSKPFSHIVTFLLPAVTLPPGTAAAIYLATAADIHRAEQSGGAPSFRFLGGIGPGKESAVFKIGFSQAGSAAAESQGLVIGIDVEEEGAVAAKLQELQAGRSAASAGGPNQGGGPGQPSTVVLAQRIIQNAFNFLSSFSGQAGPGGLEVVPLKAFEEWWKKFEGRVRADPSFLEKQSD